MNTQQIEQAVEGLNPRAARLTALWATEGFRARMAQRKRRPRSEVQAERATRQARRELRAIRAAERQAKRETREQRRQEREKERRERLQTRERRQAEKAARMNAPLPKVQFDSEATFTWATLRRMKVTVQENGKIVRRSLSELGEI